MKATIIGCGKISEQHLIALKSITGTQVTGLCDLSSALAGFTAEKFSIPHWYTDYHRMLEEQKPDVVHVLTPPATHDRIVRDCVDSGSHVIVEKPVALSNKAFRDLYAYASSKGVKVIENHNYRFNGPILQLENAVTGGRIGDVKEVEVRMVLGIRGGGRYSDPNMPHPSHKLPAGIIHEYITHLVYLLLHFMPAGSIDRLDRVCSAWRNHGGGTLFTYDDLDALVIAGDVHGRVRFSCHQWPDSFSVQVRGTGGAVFAELFNPVFLETIPRAGGKHLTPLINAVKSSRKMFRSGFGGVWGKVKNIGAYDGLFRHIKLIYQALGNGTEPPVGYREMDEAGRMIDAILDSENRI